MAPGDKHKFSIVGGGVLLDPSFVGRYEAALAAVGRRVPLDDTRVAKFNRSLASLFESAPREVVEGMVPNLRRGSWDFRHNDAFRALPEAWQLVQVAENLLTVLGDQELRRLFRKGNEHPALDGQTSFARDKQFELYLAALCHAAGGRIALVEPDLSVAIPSGPLVVAVKRVRGAGSTKKGTGAVANRLDDAEDQIVRSGVAGLCVLDVTLLVDPASVWIGHWRTDPLRTILEHLTHLVFTEHGHAFRRKRHQLVAGHVVHCAFPAMIDWFRWGFLEAWLPVQHDGHDATSVRAFLDLIAQGIAVAQGQAPSLR